MRVALLQMTASDHPEANLLWLRDAMARAASDGARLILTPEASNCISLSRRHQQAVLHSESDDPLLAALSDEARRLGIWLNLGSLAVKTDAPDGRFANRSLLIDPNGAVVARYDKIHMFDVTLSEQERYEESAGYQPGTRAVLHDCGFAKLGLTICYDLRFPALYRRLAQAGAQILLVPSAFSPVSGAAHWETLLRARAIETGAFVLAAAQTGTHPSQGRARQTYGHSLVVSPWGEILADGGTDPGIVLIDLDLKEVAQARKRMPSLIHDRPFEGPE